MEYSSRSGGNPHATELAGIEFQPTPFVMLGYFLALWAVYAQWVESLKKELKASIVGRNLLVEVFYSVGSHHFSPISLYTYTISHNLLNVKG